MVSDQIWWMQEVVEDWGPISGVELGKPFLGGVTVLHSRGGEERV